MRGTRDCEQEMVNMELEVLLQMEHQQAAQGVHENPQHQGVSRR